MTVLPLRGRGKTSDEHALQVGGLPRTEGCRALLGGGDEIVEGEKNPPMRRCSGREGNEQCCFFNIEKCLL